MVRCGTRVCMCGCVCAYVCVYMYEVFTAETDTIPRSLFIEDLFLLFSTTGSVVYTVDGLP